MKTQAQQQRMVRKRTKVSENVELITNEREEDVEETQQDLVHYLAKLFTLLTNSSVCAALFVFNISAISHKLVVEYRLLRATRP